jgi:hypothetical protein
VVELGAALRGWFSRGGWLVREEFLLALRGAQGRGIKVSRGGAGTSRGAARRLGGNLGV